MYNRAGILSGLATRAFGQNLYFYEETGSTNDDIKGFCREPEGTLVVAETQNAGKGRRGRSWSSPPGENLYFSLLLKPEIPPEDTPAITLTAGLAVCETIRRITGLDAGIKWPNDVLAQGKKLCGILTEAVLEGDSLSYAVLGIGVNLNTEAFPPEAGIAGSLRMLTGREWDRRTFLQALLLNLEQRYETYLKSGFSGLLADYKALSVTLGKEVDIHGRTSFFGRAVDIASDGSLLVETASGVVTVRSGEATLRERS